MELVSKYCLIAVFLLLCNPARALQTCQVLLPFIADRYEGDCKNGKAHGKGTAVGIDQYSGDFRNGLPHGKGVYRWSNGNFYDGKWVKGMKNGAGGMAYRRIGKLDSLVIGFWKDDTYVGKKDYTSAGKNENEFTILSRSVMISDAKVTYTPSTLSEITIMLNNNFGNMPTPDGPAGKKLTDISVLKGSYSRQIVLFETNRLNSYKLEHVIFPFKAKFKIDNQEVEVEFIEQGKYAFAIRLNN